MAPVPRQSDYLDHLDLSERKQMQRLNKKIYQQEERIRKKQSITAFGIDPADYDDTVITSEIEVASPTVSAATRLARTKEAESDDRK
jgi:hypothetical protein